MLLGRLLCLLRTDAGFSQRTAACQAQISPNYLSMVEHDKTIPTEARLRTLARLYECDPKPLLLARGACIARGRHASAPPASASRGSPAWPAPACQETRRVRTRLKRPGPGGA